MANRLDELLSRSLAGSAGYETPGRLSNENLGAVVRRRGARQNRLRRMALAGAAVALLVGSTALVSNYRREFLVVDADLGDQPKSSATKHVPTDQEIAAMVDELMSTSKLVREAVERMQSDEQSRQLSQQLARLEMPDTIEPAIDRTVAMGIAEAQRLAAARPQEASERLAHLVELFPNSSLAADVRSQLHQIQTREVMP